MSRVAFDQHDLFATPEPPGRPSQPPDPLAELGEMLDRFARAERMPWPDAAASVADELKALGLAAAAGPEGHRLATAILEQTERLLSASD